MSSRLPPERRPARLHGGGLLARARYHASMAAHDAAFTFGLGGRWLAPRPGSRILVCHGVPAAVFVTAIRATGGDILWPDALDLSSHLHPGPLTVAGETFVRGRRGEHVSAAGGETLKARAKRSGPEFLTGLLRALPSPQARFTINPFISWENQVRCLYAGRYS